VTPAGSVEAMSDELLETLETLERQGWDALCDGTASEFYGSLMTSDGLMVLANGARMTRDDVVTALRGAPTWDGYDLADVRFDRDLPGIWRFVDLQVTILDPGFVVMTRRQIAGHRRDEQ